MNKPKQLVIGIIFCIIGLAMAFLPLIDGIPSVLSSVAMPLICLSIFIIVYSFDWATHGKH